MKHFFIRIIRLYFGIFLTSVGVVMTYNANLGLSPWDVFHQGISKITGITIGVATIIVGVVIVIINAFMRERLGWGTLINMVFVGVFIDLLMLNGLIPVFHSFVARLAMMLAGLFVIGVGSFFYIGSGLGAGPRDGLMVVLTQKTKKSVRLVRSTIETAALVIGFALGGTVGVGTVISALVIGFFVQLAFKIFKFDVSSVEHRYIDQDIKWIKSKLLSRSTGKGKVRQI
ncbi:MAG: YczE/YyaS/YitT family protein [Acetivibrionales bacterium]